MYHYLNQSMKKQETKSQRYKYGVIHILLLKRPRVIAKKLYNQTYNN
jgi:hypothetical protein